MPSRRQFATAAVAVLSAGCLSDSPGEPGSESTTDPESSTDTATSTDTETTNGIETTSDAETTDDDCTSGVTLSAEPFEPTEQLLWPLRDADREFVERVVSSGGVTVETVASEPAVPGGVYVELDGAYYRTEVASTGETEVPAVTLDVAWKKGREPPSGASVVAFDDLPESDREALELVVRGPSNERRGFPAQGFEATDAPAPYPDGTDGSTFVAREHVWVEWEDRAFEVRVGGETTDTVRTFEVAAAAVAESDAAFREYAADRYVLALDDLPEAERRVLETAIDGGYEGCQEGSDGYQSLQERVADGRELPDPSGGRWYVEYAGSRHQVTFRSWVE